MSNTPIKLRDLIFLPTAQSLRYLTTLLNLSMHQSTSVSCRFQFIKIYNGIVKNISNLKISEK